MPNFRIFFIFFIIISNSILFTYDNFKTIHIFVALCDNKNQGIVPVPEKLGNGNDPDNNLYRGASFGIKNFFKKSNDWEMLNCVKNKDNNVLERCIFENKKENVFIVADAYKGIKIKEAIIDFVNSAFGRKRTIFSLGISIKEINLNLFGNADLIIYVGHNGLMDFNLSFSPEINDGKKDLMIFACKSKKYFYELIKKSAANPILWTNDFMAPEAYIVKAAIEGWILKQSGSEILIRVAKEYSNYQKCNVKAALKLFSTGW